jgi:tRNA(Ile)-lysidine synthase
MRRPPTVARVLERVTATSREHHLFLPNQTVLLAVSGGPDSVCLAETIVRLRRLLKISLQIVHVDHGLRDGSSADATYVRGLGDRLRLPVHVRTLSGGTPPKGESAEAWMRDRRRFAVAEVAREIDAGRIVTAHTRDDQAETILMRLLTGSGAAGVAGIRYHAGPYVRPLLDTSRDEIEAFCRSLGLRPRRDPTNDDPAYALRNAIRLQGLPALEAAVGREVKEPMARSAALLAADDAELARQMLAVWDGAFEETETGADLLATALFGHPRPIATRLVAQAIHRCGSTASRADVDAVLDLAAGRPGRRRDLSGGLKARRDRQHVRLVAAVQTDRPEGTGS